MVEPPMIHSQLTGIAKQTGDISMVMLETLYGLKFLELQLPYQFLATIHNTLFYKHMKTMNNLILQKSLKMIYKMILDNFHINIVKFI